MGKQRKSTRSRHGLQVLTLCISTTMVLILLGMVVFSVLTARNLSAYVKENLTVTVMLRDVVSVNDAHLLCRDLYHRPYSRNIDYISKEQAKKEQSEAMGSDPSEFLGFNPFVATLEIQLKADYVNRDSLKWISKELKANAKVSDVAYQEDLMDKVNKNLQKINMILLVLAVLLTCVSFSLINNTVRLSIYSRRFIIHTMKLVGASWSFIRRPFMRSMMGVGLIAAILACCALGGGVYWLTNFEPAILNVISWVDLTIVGTSVFCFGLIITALCSFFSLNRYLRMTAGELYKI
ncbi:MAG: cell division protein FtsX [Prevotella sp.]